MGKEWTFDQPTEEGYYWIEEGITDLKIVRIKRSFFNKEKLAVTFFESGDHVDPIHMKGTRWSGPIIPPPIKILKEESDEKSNS